MKWGLLEESVANSCNLV